MKKLTILISMFFLLFAGTQSFAQLEFNDMNCSTLMLREGLVLVYGVNYNGTEYDFIMTIKELSETRIEYSYRMTNAYATNGNIIMSEDALLNATSHYNYFSGGTVELTDMTSVWMSKKVFDELTGELGKTTISVDGGKTQVELNAIEVGYDFSLYNDISKKQFDNIGYFYAETEDQQIKYWVHYSEQNPIILKMDLGWQICLKEIRDSEE
ncbi:MAG TPA: hypothetical protein PKN32_01880 [Bacteroidales bacterium]|nr:hypothetical protein [Bacteroidales bacterium]